MSGYIHGAYGSISDSVVSAADTAPSVPLIVGTAPVNLVRGYATAGIINAPVYVGDIGAKKAIGYSDDWEKFTLSEMLSALFDNANGNIGPAYFINVLNPATHKKAEQTSVSLTFANGRAYIESDTIILDTFAIADKTEGTDYNLEYNFTTGKLAITSADEDHPLTGTLTASFYEVDVAAVTDDDIIGSVSAGGVYTGLQCGLLVYPDKDAIINYVAAPGWSDHPDVYKAMVEFCQAINKHWYAMPYADIPVKSGNTAVDTIALAKTWKTSNGYDSMYTKVFWPQAKTKDGKIFHLSSLALAETLRVDASHDGVPMETCSNKSVPVAAQYFGSSNNQGFDQASGNGLNAVGITTLVKWGGTWRLWGPHTAAFVADDDGNASADVDPLAIFDTNMRMQEYIINSFEEDHGDDVDEPMDRNLKDTILEAEQQKLDALAAMGALIGSPVISFLESENSVSDMINGNFVWNISDTPTPPAKSLTAKVAYTDAGFTSYFGEEE